MNNKVKLPNHKHLAYLLYSLESNDAGLLQTAGERTRLQPYCGCNLIDRSVRFLMKVRNHEFSYS